MSENTYNGWTNYETWLIKLWQDNEQHDQDFWRDQALECLSVDGLEHSVRSMADIMKEHYEAASEELAGANGFFVDLIGAALANVNWREIAQHWIDGAINETVTPKTVTT